MGLEDLLFLASALAILLLDGDIQLLLLSKEKRQTSSAKSIEARIIKEQKIKVCTINSQLKTFLMSCVKSR
jgi:hypothetical protein